MTGTAEEEALSEKTAPAQRHPEATKRISLGLRLDAFGDNHRLAARREVTHAGGHCLTRGVRIDIAHHRDIELHVTWTKFENVAKTRVAGARVIDRELATIDLADRPTKRTLVLHGSVLGDLNHYLAVRVRNRR